MKKEASMHFLYATLFLDAVGMGIVIPMLPDMIRRFGTDESFVNQYFGFFIAVYALMQFFASPVVGSLSDKYGRRPILLASLSSSTLDYLLMAYAPTLVILFIGRVISGLTGASMTVVRSYIADVSDDTNRGANFGIAGACFAVGIIAGPCLGGLLGKLGYHVPFLGAAACCLANLAYGLFVLPESLPPEKRRNLCLQQLNPFQSLLKVFSPSPIRLLIWAWLFLMLSSQVHPSIWTLYTEHKFGWTSFQVGLSMSAVGVSMLVGEGVLTPIVIGRMGEERALVLAILIDTIALVMFGLATQGWMMYAILAGSVVCEVSGPALQSLLSKSVPDNQQGELQGTLTSIGSCTAILAPLIYTSLFNLSEGKVDSVMSGMPYFGAAMVSAVCLALVICNDQRKGAQTA